ncbi:MAG: DNA-binding response regulator [Betaproteobacteria bacterium RIFCSPLOWO2_12_FULL_64_23]|nr:MAG: DNA-binding response regulator [Betaproteobacteria bacterium RIFCSPLOWO2_12_FULL_64_23]
MRILVVEDEPKTADYLRQGLSESGYAVDVAIDGIDGRHLAQETEYDLVVLDVNLPGMDGWSVLQSIRSRGDTPVLMLTARGFLNDKVKGFDLGADDYLVKPFQFPELLARVRRLLHRGVRTTVPDVLRIADLELDSARHRALRGSTRIGLTAKEFALLHLFMRRTGEVLTRTQIASLVWDMNFDSDTNVVEVAIRRLRVKVDEPFERKLIHTVRGVGYVLEERT